MAESLDHGKPRVHRVLRVMRIFHRRAEQPHHHVAHKLVERAIVRVQHADHLGEVLIELRDHRFGSGVLGRVRETANI